MSKGLDINVPKSCRLYVRIYAYIGIGPKGIYVDQDVYRFQTLGSAFKK